jgi:hypothetical protein
MLNWQVRIVNVARGVAGDDRADRGDRIIARARDLCPPMPTSCSSNATAVGQPLRCEPIGGQPSPPLGQLRCQVRDMQGSLAVPDWDSNLDQVIQSQPGGNRRDIGERLSSSVSVA